MNKSDRKCFYGFSTKLIQYICVSCFRYWICITFLNGVKDKIIKVINCLNLRKKYRFKSAKNV